MNRNLTVISVLAASVLLASCGGGGGGGDGGGSSACTPSSVLTLVYKDARVGSATTFSNSNLYFATLEKVNFSPVLGEVCGATKTFSGTMPAGLVLDRSTGTVSGTPTTMRANSFIVNLTVQGYTPLSSRVDFTVDDFDFTYKTGFTPAGNSVGSFVSLTPELNEGSISPSAGSSRVNGQSNADRGSLIPAGTTSVYSIASGALPPGLSLNPATGAISGTFAAAGIFNVSIGLQVTFEGVTLKVPPSPFQSLMFNVR